MNFSLDYHAHILPGCDHGCDSVATSVLQLSMAKSAGIEAVCATSHFYPQKESVAGFLKKREHAFEALFPHLTADLPSIQLGAEVLICEGMDRMDGIEQLCREGTNELLLEMPFYTWQESIWDTLYRLNERGDLRIVIAHADRYPTENIEMLIRSDIPLQLNAGSLLHPFKRGRLLRWIKDGAVQYLGSDIHMRGEAYNEWKKSVKLIKSKCAL